MLVLFYIVNSTHEVKQYISRIQTLFIISCAALIPSCIITFFKVRKLSTRALKSLVKDHATGEEQGWNLNPGSLASELNLPKQF